MLEQYQQQEVDVIIYDKVLFLTSSLIISAVWSYELSLEATDLNSCIHLQRFPSPVPHPSPDMLLSPFSVAICTRNGLKTFQTSGCSRIYRFVLSPQRFLCEPESVVGSAEEELIHFNVSE